MRFQAGSFVNQVMAQSKNPTPVVGMGATHCAYSDRHPYTVIEVSKSGRVVTLQEDTAIRTDKNGMSESQTYEFTPNPKGAIRKASLRKNGQWVEVNGSDKFSLGHRSAYYDYSTRSKFSMWAKTRLTF